MCGRFSMAIDKDEFFDYLYDQFDIDETDESIILPRYNVAPGQKVISVINDGVENRVGEIKWGLVPKFAKDENIGYKMINARSETLHEKASFKNAYQSKRCIILADGYYEWHDKLPYRIRKQDQSVFGMAGLWEQHVRKDGTKLYTCTIITTNANDKLSGIHNRMPVILDKEQMDVWLDPKNGIDDVKNLLNPYSSEKVEFYPVSLDVNKVSNDYASIIEKNEL